MQAESIVPGILWPGFPGILDAHVLAFQFQLQQTQWWPPDRLRRRQLEQIEQLIPHAARTVPIYREYLAGIGSLQHGRLNMPTFRQLPVRARSELVQSPGDLQSQRLPPSHGQVADVIDPFSPETGLAMQGNTVTQVAAQAFELRWHLWHRRDSSAKSLSILARGDAQPNNAWMPAHVTGPAPVLARDLSTADLLAAVFDEQPIYLRTDPSTLRRLMRHVQQVAAVPASLREVVVYGGVTDTALLDQCRRLWNVKVTHNYRTPEAGVIALPCREYSRYHVQAEGVLVEVVGENGAPCAAGIVGRVVVTLLHNFATPLIRVDIGDLASLGRPCPCGRGLPVLTPLPHR